MRRPSTCTRCRGPRSGAGVSAGSPGFQSAHAFDAWCCEWALMGDYLQLGYGAPGGRTMYRYTWAGIITGSGWQKRRRMFHLPRCCRFRDGDAATQISPSSRLVSSRCLTGALSSLVRVEQTGNSHMEARHCVGSAVLYIHSTEWQKHSAINQQACAILAEHIQQ
jgi:hypothetical protein